MENHYKDGMWRYPEFAQPEDIFLEIVDRIDSPYFRRAVRPVERDGRRLRSGAISGEGPPRVVTMHASDRFLAPGATLDDLRTADGIDRLLRRSCGMARPARGSTTTTPSSACSPSVGFTGWISVEDGMNGLDELRRSVDVPQAEARGALLIDCPRHQ